MRNNSNPLAHHHDSKPTDSSPPVTTASARKREQLGSFINQKMAPHAAVQAVAVYGSVATGIARPDSDIDAYVFMDPLDPYIVPAESMWRERDDTFHSIFADDPSLEEDGIQLDLHRVDLTVWQHPGYVWPEHIRAELADGWIAFDRHDAVAPLITARTSYPDDERLRALDEAVNFVAAQLPGSGAPDWHPPDAADMSDGLQAAYDYWVHALFAYNQRWLPWRNRQMRTLLRLPWLPPNIDHDLLDAAVSSGHDHLAYLTRAEALRRLLDELLHRLAADRIYHTDDPISEAFKRGHDEPGRAWNMSSWTIEHRRRFHVDKR